MYKTNLFAWDNEIQFEGLIIICFVDQVKLYKVGW